MKLNFTKEILVSVVFCVIFMQPINGVAGQYILNKKRDSTGYAFSDSSGVCAAYEKNLAQFSNEPYGMACGRKLDPKFGFTRPTWEKLDVASHEELVFDLYRAFRWADKVTNDIKIWKEYFNDMLINTKSELLLARVDIDNDGSKENIVRFRTGKEAPCNPQFELVNAFGGRSQMALVNAELTKVIETLSTTDDLLLYKDTVYSDSLYGYGHSDDLRRIKGFDAALYFYKFGSHGPGVICKFDYYEQPIRRSRNK